MKKYISHDLKQLNITVPSLKDEKTEDINEIFVNLPEDKKIIMLPARFTAWKGHEFLIDALAQVKGNFCCIFGL